MQLEPVLTADGKEVENTRYLQLDNNKIYFKYTDPFGFIKVSFDKGQMPEYLRGDFTSLEAAKNAVKGYLAVKKREVK